MSLDFRRGFSYSALDNQQVPPMGTAAHTTINMDQYEDVNIRVIHQVPRNKDMWTHISDLDTFFTNIYEYYIWRGFKLMCKRKIYKLLQFIFIWCFSTWGIYCVDYSPLSKAENYTQITFSDMIRDSSVCIHRISWMWWLLFTLAIIFWVFNCCQSVYKLYHAYNIKLFYNNVLKIDDSDLKSTNWSTVQDRVKEAQKEHLMCIHKMEINELDIYHRILRFDNYMVAMVNKNVLPLQIKVPFYGNVHYLSKGLQRNLKILLFSSPWSPWENCSQLRSSYKNARERMPLSQQLEKQITLMALVNLLLSPLIFIWQILDYFHRYIKIKESSPALLSKRIWSAYARIVLRHYNELNHEFDDRLDRAYKPATKYLASFSSPGTVYIAKILAIVPACILGYFFILLTIYDERVLHVPHVMQILAISALILRFTKQFTSEEDHLDIVRSGSFRKEELFLKVQSHIHYPPAGWRTTANTKDMVAQFQQLFQYIAHFILFELLSPVVTPFMLYSLRTKALDIVDFYRNFTVSVDGIGDVCSFAQLDVQKHGHPNWLPPGNCVDKCKGGVQNPCIRDQNGKTELSLMAFSYRHPGWKPENQAQQLFLRSLRESRNNTIPDFTGMNETTGGSYINQSFTSTTTPLPMVLSYYPEQRQQIRIPDLDETSSEDEEAAQGFSDTTCGVAGVRSGLGVNALDLDPHREPDDQVREMSNSALYLHDIHEIQAKSNAEACCLEKCNELEGKEVNPRTKEDTPLLRFPYQRSRVQTSPVWI